jgi:hypothetical protein
VESQKIGVLSPEFFILDVEKVIPKGERGKDVSGDR